MSYDCNAITAYLVLGPARKERVVASITVRNLDDGLKRRLRIRAAENDRSMEQEVREILRTVLAEDSPTPKRLGSALHTLFKPFGGVTLDIPSRSPMREPPKFD